MINVLAELRRWAASLDYWEQAALERIVVGTEFTHADYDELLGYLLQDAGVEQVAGSRMEIRFPKWAEEEVQPVAPIQLVQISNLQNVNALVGGQTLTFGPAMTAIYGGNGSGKSGYARVLGCAGFTRGDQEVLPDVTQPADGSVELSADIEILEGGNIRSIPYKIGGQCPWLSTCYVFDSTSVRVHLTQSNALSFSPAGLSYLTRLAEVTDEVRRRLKKRVEVCSGPHDFDTLFQGESEVRTLIADLGPNTHLQALQQLAKLSPEEEEKIRELDVEIARLKVQDVSEQMRELKQSSDDLTHLVDNLRVAGQRLSDESLEAVREALRNHVGCRSAAKSIGVDQFKSEHFQLTGRKVWYRFIEAAKALADAEQLAAAPYPQPGSRCLLCQQPLSIEARDLLQKLWAFLEGEAQKRLTQAKRALDEQIAALEAVSLDFFDEQSVSFRTLQERSPDLVGKVSRFLTACVKRRGIVQEAVAAEEVEKVFPSLPNNGIQAIEEISEWFQEQLAKLKKRDVRNEIEKLEKQMRLLQHRSLLSEHLAQIEAYVEKQIWAHRAAKAGGSTHHITRKHNQLFRKLVTRRYIQLFEKTLKDLGRSLRVAVTTKGRKGATFKQIIVKADPSRPAGITAPDRVLSEGEKRAVALADFLTEVALDTTSGAVILDDPVTSLDVEWRALIASILAEESRRRQVIVFTHDLPFLYYLKQSCEREQVEVVAHWIKRGDHDDRPGYVFLDNSPALERDYRRATRAREIYKQAKHARPVKQQALLRDGFGALRTCYEAFIIFELLNEVVQRFNERISFGRLAGIAWDKAIVDEVIGKCELLSRYIEGHLHSNALEARKPKPEILLYEIEAFEALRKRLNAIKKSL